MHTIKYVHLWTEHSTFSSRFTKFIWFESLKFQLTFMRSLTFHSEEVNSNLHFCALSTEPLCRGLLEKTHLAETKFSFHFLLYKIRFLTPESWSLQFYDFYICWSCLKPLKRMQLSSHCLTMQMLTTGKSHPSPHILEVYIFI